MENEFIKEYLDELKNMPTVEGEELSKLVSELPQKAAKERLIKGSLAYAARLAEEYAAPDAEAADLLQEGSMALTLLVNNYKEGDFALLRERALRAAMQAYCESQKQNMKIGQQMAVYINVMNEVTTRLAKELGREATVSEVAEKMQLPEDEIRILMKEALNAVNTQEGGV